MENNPLQTMFHEHDVICQTEVIIKNLDQAWENNEANYVHTVSKLIEFFREYSDGYHHRKEEEVLFPAVHDYPDFVLQEILEEFETHHEDFREYTKEIENALSEGDYIKSYKELNRYLQDLLDHIGAENDELFVLAESLLNEEQLETLFFKFKDIDLELGENRKMEFEEWIRSYK